MKNIFGLIIILMSGLVSAATLTATGDINMFRIASSSHPKINEYEAGFSLTPAQPTCTWLKLAPGSDAFISGLLFKKAQNKPITVWFESSTCQAITIEL